MSVSERLAAVVTERLRFEEPLARYTTMRIGGPAEFLALANSTAEVVALVATARSAGIPWRVIGRGSNLLVSDRGVRGLVIRNASADLDFADMGGGRWHVRADAGASLARVAGECARRGLVGFAFAVAIPGTIGGAVAQNAGAHHREMVDVLVDVLCLDPRGDVAPLPVNVLELGYRTSRFKRHPREETVLTATIAVTLADLPAAEREIEEIRAWRAEHQPAEPSAGSIFANPPGDYAGRLIDAAGLKGHAIGGAQVSTRHANFVVNLGAATAADVKALIDLAQSEVQKRFGISLEREVELFGEWEPA